MKFQEEVRSPLTEYPVVAATAAPEIPITAAADHVVARPPQNLSHPRPRSSVSLPALPVTRSVPASAQITSSCCVPRSRSSPAVPTIVHSRPPLGASGKAGVGRSIAIAPSLRGCARLTTMIAACAGDAVLSANAKASPRRMTRFTIPAPTRTRIQTARRRCVRGRGRADRPRRGGRPSHRPPS